MVISASVSLKETQKRNLSHSCHIWTQVPPPKLLNQATCTIKPPVELLQSPCLIILSIVQIQSPGLWPLGAETDILGVIHSI